MSLLSRYKGHRSSLSLLHPKDPTKSPMQKVFLSYKNATLAPLETIALNEEKEKEQQSGNKPVDTDQLPNADDDMPQPAQVQNHDDIQLEKPRDLPSPSNPDFSEILKENINVCKTMCDFSVETFDADAKQIKTNSLNSILLMLSTLPNISQLQPEDYALIADMVDAHLLRHFDSIPAKFLFSDDLVVLTETAMPHITIAYQIANKFIDLDDSLDIHWIRKYINRFLTPDASERQELATLVLHWANKHNEQQQIKKIMCDILSNYLCKTGSPHTVLPALNVLKEILDIPNDKTIYELYILPMLGAPHIVSFNKELFSLIEAFVDADNALLVPSIKAVMYHWPKTRSAKLIIFLQQLTQLLAKVKARDFKDLRVPAFKLYGDAAISQNYKVAEAAFSVWTKLPLEPLIMDSAKYVFPLIYYPIANAIKSHWSSSVIDTMNNTLEAMNKIDSFLFQELCRSKKQPEERDLVRLWAVVSRTAMHHDRELNLAAKLAEIQKTFTKPVQQTQNQPPKQQPNQQLNASNNKRVIQPQVQRSQSRSSRY